MALIYTTLDWLKTRLAERFNQDGAMTTYSTRPTIDDNILLEVAEKIESRVTNALARHYVTPLALINSHTRKAIARVVELLTICEYLPIYFRGVSISEEGGKYRDFVCSLGETGLQELLDNPLPDEDRLTSSISSVRYTTLANRLDADPIESVNF